MHKVPVNHLVKLGQEKSVVMWSDHPNITIAVDWGIKQQNKQTKLSSAVVIDTLILSMLGIVHAFVVVCSTDFLLKSNF